MKRTILLVGGNSGIGLELAKALLAKGDRVVALSRSDDQLKALGIETHPFDATSDNELPELPTCLDGVVYCPGTINLKPFHRLTDEDFQQDLQVNFLGAVRVLQAALPSLKKAEAPSAVLFSTVAVHTGMPFHASISAAKAAVESLARTLAAEWAPGIRVNAIAPSLTDTNLASNLLSDEKRREAAANRHPLKAVGHPADVAALATLLLDPTSKFITGQVLRPDGGMSSLRLL